MIIDSFNIDTTPISQDGESRIFEIVGTPGAIFSLEIKNEDPKYYNFSTKVFQTAATRLNFIEIPNGGVYSVIVNFPKISDNDHYDIYLFAEHGRGTRHANYNEVRNADGSININESTGSNSSLLKKKLYQYTDLTLTLSALAIDATVSSGTQASASVATSINSMPISRGKTLSSVPFTVTITSPVTQSYEIKTLPTEDNIVAYVTRAIDDAILIDGEDQYATLRATDTTDGTNDGIKIVMDNTVASNMIVGDRVTGNAALNASTTTVAALNPDEDNVKEFSVGPVEVETTDGITLSFYKKANYKWNIDNIVGITNDMIPKGTNVTSGSKVADYENTTQITAADSDSGLIYTTTHINAFSPGVKYKGTPVYTDGVLTSQSGEITFDKQQLNVFEGDNVRFYAKGREQVKSLTGYDFKLSNLKIYHYTTDGDDTTFSNVQTTTTSAVNNSVTIPVAQMKNIMANKSTMSGIGVNPAVVDPTVTAKSATNGAGNLTVSAAQTIESGQTLTFSGASGKVVITGEIELLEIGNSNVTLYFDFEKFLSFA